jgi:hypothetical protein
MRLEELKLLETTVNSVKVVFTQRDHTEEYCSYSNAKLTSLEGSPKHVSDDFTCYSNNLKSLKGGPEYVGSDFYCFDNVITSLEDAPSYIGGEFLCHNNNLTSLHNIHKQIKHIGQVADFQQNPIKSCVLGLLLIEGLKQVLIDDNSGMADEPIHDIINRHLEGDRDVFACQEDLINAGYEDYAKL